MEFVKETIQNAKNEIGSDVQIKTEQSVENKKKDELVSPSEEKKDNKLN